MIVQFPILVLQINMNINTYLNNYFVLWIGTKWSSGNQTLPTQLNNGHHAQYALLYRLNCKICKYLKFHQLRHVCKQQIICNFIDFLVILHNKTPDCSLSLHYCFILGSNIWALTSISQDLLGLSVDWMRERKIIWKGNSHNLHNC